MQAVYIAGNRLIYSPICEVWAPAYAGTDGKHACLQTPAPARDAFYDEDCSFDVFPSGMTGLLSPK